MGKWLLVSRLSKYAPIMFTCSTINFNRYDIARNILNNFFLTVGENVSLKSIPWIWEKPWATNLTLYWVTVPSEWYLTWKIYFNPTAFLLGGRLSYSQVSWFSRFWISSLMAFFNCLSWIGSFIVSSYVFDLYTLLLISEADIACFEAISLLSWCDFSASALFSIAISSVSLEDDCSIAWIFWGQPLGLGSPVGPIFFVTVVKLWVRSRACLISSFAPCSDLSI